MHGTGSVTIRAILDQLLRTCLQQIWNKGSNPKLSQTGHDVEHQVKEL